MNEQFAALIAALADNAELRAEFLAAKDMSSRIAIAKAAGLDVPSEKDIAAVAASVEAGEGIPARYQASAFWFSA